MTNCSGKNRSTALFRPRFHAALLASVILAAPAALRLPAAENAAFKADFEALDVGSIGGRDGWKSPNDQARVETSPESEGKYLKLNFPYGNVGHDVAVRGDVVVTEFSIKMESRSGAEFGKVLVTLDDAGKKNVLLFFHDSNGQWGIKNGNGWSFSKAQPAGESWRRVRITTDSAQHKNSVDILDADGKTWVTLFKDAAFSTADAGAIAAISFVRNAQGDPSAVLIDNIAIGGPTPVAQAPATPVTGAIVEDFDRLNESTINGQNGWTSKQNCPVQTLFNANGGGKALDLQFPYGDAGKIMARQGVTGQATLDFKIYLPESEGDKKAKFLLTLKSSDGKTVALFFHDDNANWGLQTGNGWRFSPDKTKPATWLPIRIAMDLSGQSISVYSGQGNSWKPLFKGEAPVDTAAKDVASVALQRNGQGAPVSVYIDDLSLSPGLLATTQKVEATSLAAMTPAHEGYSIFRPDEKVEILFTVDHKKEEPADTIAWDLRDWRDQSVKTGQLELPAGENTATAKLHFEALPAGYYALSARRASNGDTLPAMGSRPKGILSFGILPPIEPLALQSGDDSRFGMYGTNFIRTREWLKGDPFDPLYDLLGVRWVEINRSWSRQEPNQEGEYQPRTQDPSGTEGSYRAVHKLGTLVAVTGIPNWAVAWPAGVTPPAKESMLNHAYPPKDMNQYATYLRKIAREQYDSRKAYFPYMKHTYYMIHHEPDWHWKGTDAEFIDMYKTAHKALHEGDPDALLIGPRFGVLAKGVSELERLLPQGLGEHLDGLATHMYYLPPRLTVTPEQAGTIENFRRLRALAKKYLKPDALMAQMEWGVRYVESYDDLSPDIFRQHAAQFVRGHLIALGEGMNLTFMFYSSDYSGEPGYGVTYNLTMPEPNFGAIATSPKPAAMAVAAMTRLLEGTRTIGPIATDSEIVAYSFKRNDRIVSAMWAPKATDVAIDTRWNVQDQSIELIDTMGNTRKVTPVGGAVKIQLGFEPVYVLSASPISLAK